MTQGEPSDQQVVYVKSTGNGLAIAALVCGVVGALFGLVPLLFFIALPLGVLALIFGLVGHGRARRDPNVGRKGMAAWGAVLGVVAIGLGLLGVTLLGNAADDLDESFDKLDQEFRKEIRQDERQLNRELKQDEKQWNRELKQEERELEEEFGY